MKITTTGETSEIDWHTKQWFALHTKSRHEKLVQKTLLHRGIEVYLPMRRIKRKWSDRIQEVSFPLFAGYLFVQIPLIDKDQVAYNKGVIRLLGEGFPEAVSADQIQSLKKFENQEIEVDPFPDLEEGKSVRVVRGPLKGSEGVLLKKKSKYRFFLYLKVLSQAVSVEVDAADIKPLH